MLKYAFFTLLILFSQLSFSQVPSALLHQVDKDQIFRTFEIKPFTFSPSTFQGKSIEEARVLATQLAVASAAENLFALARYANVPTSFYDAEMAEIRLKALLSVSRINDPSAFLTAQFPTEVNRLIKEQLDIFIHRPYLDTYFDLKEVIKELKTLQAAQNQQPASVAAAPTQKTVNEEPTLLGIKFATPLNLSLLALILAILAFINSAKKTTSRR